MIRRRTVLLGAALAVGLACARNPVTGKNEISLVSESQEIEMGKQAAQEVGQTMGYVDNAGLESYVSAIGMKMAKASERPNLPWEFHVVDDAAVNAFALPGGFIYVTRGILPYLDSEAELAGVLGHEIAHVVKKHQLTAIQSGMKADFWKSVGTSVVADRVKIGGGAVGSTVGNMAKPYILDAAGNLIKDGFFLRPLDRGLESEADQLGIILAARSGYDPYGLVGALQMLAQAKGDGDAASIFSTHPAPADRIAEIEKAMPAIERHTANAQRLEGRFRQTVGAAK